MASPPPARAGGRLVGPDYRSRIGTEYIIHFLNLRPEIDHTYGTLFSATCGFARRTHSLVFLALDCQKRCWDGWVGGRRLPRYSPPFASVFIG